MFVNIFLYDDFHAMDAFAPAQVFGYVPEHFYIRYISLNGGLINSKQGLKVWTEPLNPKEIEDVLIIPGGPGAHSFLQLNANSLNLIADAVQEASYVLMVQNGSSILAKSGALFRRQVADYHFEENWKRMFTVGVEYVQDVKWLADGKFYSSSCTLSALDMSLSVIADIVDMDQAERIAQLLGYQWDGNSETDFLC